MPSHQKKKIMFAWLVFFLGAFIVFMVGLLFYFGLGIYIADSQENSYVVLYRLFKVSVVVFAICFCIHRTSAFLANLKVVRHMNTAVMASQSFMHMSVLGFTNSLSGLYVTGELQSILSNLFATGIPFLICFTILIVVVYFLPSMIAFNRNHSSRLAILVINLFLGWSLVGWFIALIWSGVGQHKST